MRQNAEGQSYKIYAAVLFCVSIALCGRGVPGAVVDEYYLEIPIALPEDGQDAFVDISFDVVYGYDDGDQVIHAIHLPRLPPGGRKRDGGIAPEQLLSGK